MRSRGTTSSPLASSTEALRPVPPMSIASVRTSAGKVLEPFCAIGDIVPSPAGSAWQSGVVDDRLEPEPLDPRPSPHPGRTVGFVLSGGGSLGAVQAGMVIALAEQGICPQVLAGASAGALNCAFLAAHPGLEGAELLSALWRAIRRR